MTLKNSDGIMTDVNILEPETLGRSKWRTKWCWEAFQKRIAYRMANYYELYMHWNTRQNLWFLASTKCHGNGPFAKTCLAVSTQSIQTQRSKKTYKNTTS